MINEDFPTTPDVARLRKGVEWVEAQAQLDPIVREWQQDYWVSVNHAELRATVGPESDRSDNTAYGAFLCRSLAAQETCGTAYCLAGWIGHEDGVLATPNGRESLNLSMEARRRYGVAVVGDYAERRLGLMREQADRLFDQDNTAADIRRIAEDIAGEAL